MHKKLFLITVLFFLILLASFAWASDVPSSKVVFEIGSNTYILNDKTATMEAAPFIENNRTFVPVRYLALSLGVSEDDIVWSASARTVTLKADDVSVEMAVGGNILYVNDSPREMDVTPVIKNGRTYLPARYVAESLGYKVRWDAANRSVFIEPERAAAQPAATEAEKAVEQAKFDLADNKGISISTVSLKEFVEVDWPDTSLGCPEPGCMYAQVITPGYKIILSDGSTDYEYHADKNGNVVSCNP